MTAVADIEEAIYLHREAISLCSTSHLAHSELVECLIKDLELHFTETQSGQSLDEAIMLYQQLADLPADKAKKHSWVLEGLSKKLQHFFALHNNPQDLKEVDEMDDSLTRDQDSTVTSAKAGV
ncbi:hypothetical protein CVT26_012322 [Gymnopilus dilepis]|uniref:Uncharacterized protein n=1 Tax=Gymnopilus dilepis TaxID=231916 RepID=A0A409YCD1_9AGAR|nr:hypothetical protein CVT26_012322 [Gymnopilus dilepis]